MSYQSQWTSSLANAETLRSQLYHQSCEVAAQVVVLWQSLPQENSSSASLATQKNLIVQVPVLPEENTWHHLSNLEHFDS